MIPNRYFDKFGLLVTRNGDGGDCAARMGLWLVSSYCLYQMGKLSEEEFKQIRTKFEVAVLGHLEIAPGLFIRHPGQSVACGQPGGRDFACWNRWQVFSRDQFLLLVLGLYICGHSKVVEEALYGLKKRHGIQQNGGFTGPHHWSILCRTGFDGPFSKRRNLGDFFLFLGVVIQSFKSEASDAINGFGMMMFCHYFQPTFWSKAAMWWAKRFDNYEETFLDYFGNPDDPGAPFDVYCQPIFKQFFTKGK